jgi:hypothetical protein
MSTTILRNCLVLKTTKFTSHCLFHFPSVVPFTNDTYCKILELKKFHTCIFERKSKQYFICNRLVCFLYTYCVFITTFEVHNNRLVCFLYPYCVFITTFEVHKLCPLPDKKEHFIYLSGFSSNLGNSNTQLSKHLHKV